MEVGGPGSLPPKPKVLVEVGGPDSLPPPPEEYELMEESFVGGPGSLPP